MVFFVNNYISQVNHCSFGLMGVQKNTWYCFELSQTFSAFMHIQLYPLSLPTLFSFLILSMNVLQVKVQAVIKPLRNS